MKLIVAVLMLFNVSFLYAQDFDTTKLDRFFSVLTNHQKGMGSLSIYKAGNGIYRNAMGYAVLEDSIQNTVETKFRIGSVSKTFTAVLILQLIEEEKLKLETKLSEFYPQLPNADEITVEHLLRHRSGLFNFTNASDYVQWMQQSKSRSELIEIFVNNGTAFSPGEKTGYSNTNYVLLSYMAEKIEEKDYAEILQQRIVKPLKLKNTYYGGPIDLSKNEVYSYNKLGAWEKMPETNMHIPAGAGGIVSNSRDLNVFYHALFAGGLLSDEVLQQMLTITDQMGMGIIQMPYREKRIFGHSGAIDGFYTQVMYIPQDSVSIAYCSNGVDMPVNEIMIGILEIFYGHDFEMPDFEPAWEVSSDALDPYLGVYSSAGFPLKITITKNGDQLLGQATGQQAFPLEPYEKHKFKFDPAQLKIEFVPDKDKLILKQHEGVFELTKEE